MGWVYSNGVMHVCHGVELVVKEDDVVPDRCLVWAGYLRDRCGHTQRAMMASWWSVGWVRRTGEGLEGEGGTWVRLGGLRKRWMDGLP